MENILTVSTAATATALTTLERVKADLNITASDKDELLEQKIAEATSDIESHCGRTFCRESLSELFFGGGFCDRLILDRYPVASITSVTVDDVVLETTEYRLDGKNGFLYRLDASGYVIGWTWCRDITVAYDAGYIMPGEQNRDLPPALEAGAIDLVKSFWLSRGRDPLVKSVNIPGVMEQEFWVGSVGEAGELPPSVQEKVSPFRRASV